MSRKIPFVTSQNDFDAYLAKNQLLVAQFTATWCGPCRAILPVVDELYTKDAYADIEFVRADLDLQQAVLTTYSITSVPTFVYFNSGIEVSRVSGANAREITMNLDRLAESAATSNHGRNGNGSAAKAEKWLHVSHLIPKGYEILNDSIDFTRFEALNIVCNSENTTTADPSNERDRELDVKDTFKTSSDPITVTTDTDSQGILYIPFLNVTKIYSILIMKSAADDTQPPNHIKIWSNQHTAPLFESAMDDSACPHDQRITHKGETESGGGVGGIDTDEWFTCPVKYVRFQNCLSITIFIDGADEDTLTSWDKILLVGISGDLTELKTISRE